MTKAQKSLYWREWGRVRKVKPDADRHTIHSQALGLDKSSKSLTNRDFDRILAAFRAITRPDDLGAQLAAQNQPRMRALHVIGTHDAAYVHALCRDRFRGQDPELMSDHDLAQLAMTLSNRSRSKSTEMVESIPDPSNCPF